MRAILTKKPRPCRNLVIMCAWIGGVEGLLCASVQNVAFAQEPAAEQDEQRCAHRSGHGIESVVSAHDFEATLSRVRTEIAARPLRVLVEVDHRANATSAGLELRPTTTVIFGNPSVGTQLMLAEQSVGLELPLKLLVWQDACGVVRIDYTRPSALRRRFHVRDADETFDNVSQVLKAIVTAASS